MDFKKILICLIMELIVLGVFCICIGGQKVQNNVENVQYETENNGAILSILEKSSKYSVEYNEDVTEIILKNVSGFKLKKVTFSIEDVIYELYNIDVNEEYKLMIWDNVDNLTLKIISVDYEFINYYPNEIKILVNEENNIIKGKNKNEGERNLYPIKIITFMEDKNSVISQNIINYSGCFREELVIKPQQEYEFEINVDSQNSFMKSKGIIIEYLDIDSKEYYTVIFEEM